MHACILFGNWERETYWSWDDESWEKIPQTVEERRDNGGDVVIRGDSNSHHAVEDEVEEGEEEEKQEPQEFLSSPLESHHWVHDEPIHNGLNEDIRNLNQKLHHKNTPHHTTP